MCLITFYWDESQNYLRLVANRDEFRIRPTAAAQHWEGWWGGRDLQAHGTWLAIGANRMAAITNVREPNRFTGTKSRGRLPIDFVLSDQSAEVYARTFRGESYGGLNLLLFDGHSIWCASNRSQLQHVPTGVHGLSNAQLNTPWPKVESVKQAMSHSLASAVSAIRNSEIYPDEVLPATGVPLVWERQLSAAFVTGTDYGTRSTTEVLYENGKFWARETRYDTMLRGQSILKIK